MELIERYVHAVGTYLPRAQRADIADELAEDLRCELDDRQRTLGRPLTEAEEEAMLIERGHPMTVAAGYMPQRSLIGPALLPAYLFVLKLVLTIVAAIFVLVITPIRIFHGASAGEALAALAANLWTVVWGPIGVVTVIFALLERVQRRDAGYGWSPRRLPQVRDANVIPRSESIATAALGTLFVLWWASGAPLLPAGSPGTVEQTMMRAFVPILLVALASVTLAVANALHPYWTRLRLGLRAGVDGLTAFIAFGILVMSWNSVVAQAARLGHPALLAPGEWANLSLALGLWIAGVVSLVTCVTYAVRCARST